MFAIANHQADILNADDIASMSRRRVSRILAMVVLISLTVWVGVVVHDPQTLPISKIRAQGTFNHVDEAMLQRAVAGIGTRGYFSVDVAQVQSRVEQLPWVKSATVRRVWPDTLAIVVQERSALARWVDGGLISRRGELFRPPETTYPQNLPQLQGPTGMHRSLVDYYRDANILLKPVALTVTKATLDARRALRLQLNNGMELVLGREDRWVRLQRFVQVYTKLLANKAPDIARIDLRYTNGLSIRWETRLKANLKLGGGKG